MEIVLISVMHTGTHVLMRIFDDAGFAGVPMGGQPPDAGDVYHHGHVLTMNCSMLVRRADTVLESVFSLFGS